MRSDEQKPEVQAVNKRRGGEGRQGKEEEEEEEREKRGEGRGVGR